jgi:hypothetical protein
LNGKSKLTETEKARQVKSKVKSMLITFFHIKGIVYKEFVLAGQTVNSAYYRDVLRRLRYNVHRLKALRMIVDAPWYVPNTLIRPDLQIPSVKKEISQYSSHYSTRLTAQPNDILLTLLEQPELKRLRRHLPNDLPTRFMV